jgi:hypothetical protein
VNLGTSNYFYGVRFTYQICFYSSIFTPNVVFGFEICTIKLKMTLVTMCILAMQRSGVWLKSLK